MDVVVSFYRYYFTLSYLTNNDELGYVFIPEPQRPTVTNDR